MEQPQEHRKNLVLSTTLYTFILWFLLLTLQGTWLQWKNLRTLIESDVPLGEILGLIIIVSTQPFFVYPIQGIHIVVTTGLFSWYCILLTRRLQQISRQKAAGSIAASTLSLLGFSLGITCISCGVVGISLLLSGLGASTTLLLFFEQHHLWWLTSEAALVVSILLVTRAGNILSHK